MCQIWKGGRSSYHHNHDPSINWHLRPCWESVHERNDVKKHESCQRCLVEQQLHTVHLELLVVAGNPDGI